MKKCDRCGEEFQNLGVHKRFCKGMGVEAERELSSAPTAEAPTTGVPPGEKQRYISTRSPGLTCIIKPSMRGFVQTIGGNVQTLIPGKSVQFDKGVLETDDPEVIDYFEHKYHDLKFPVTNVTKLGVK